MQSRRQLLTAAATATCCVLLVHAGVLAQAAPADSKAPPLEVISVKLNKAANESGSIGLRADGLYAQNVPLRFLLNLAFQREFGKSQMIGVPEWADVDHFDVEAKVGEADIPRLHGLKAAQVAAIRSALLRSVLSERFQFKAHIEMREAPVYALVIGKGGLKIKPAVTDSTTELKLPDGSLSPGSSLATTGVIAGHEVPFGRLLEGLLSDGQLDRVVVDRTGLTGDYDYVLNWRPEQAVSPGDDPSSASNTLPSLFTAIQEQLGLKLEPTKAPVKTLVIDRIEKPSAN